ncbi:MAG: hypothetical protein ACOYXT_15460 [Bacteroidota bacterium]
MITTNNYFTEIERIGTEALPETLRKGHELVVKSTNNGSSWAAYQSSESIRKVIDLYFQKLNDYVSSIASKSRVSAPELRTEKTPSQQTAESVVNKKPKSKAEPQGVKLVENLREEVKFIRRYVGLHNKMKTPHAILAFIKALQRSIVQKFIRKTSSLSDEIEMIQKKLVQAYNKMKGEESFAINEKDLSRLVAIAGGEKVYPSITAIKRFIGLQGKDDKKKINGFLKYLENLVEKKKLTKDDPYADKVNTIYKSIRQRTGSKISISKAELNGLEGIVKSCGCNLEAGAHKKQPKHHGRKADSLKGSKTKASNRSGSLNGVITAEEMANRKLDLLNFFSFWFTLFGNPAKNFTLMLHGEPHNGKTIFLLKFAQYLAENFGNVLYVSSEEFASPTMTKKVNEFLTPLPGRLHFAENLQDPDLSQYQFVILDSINDLGLKINEYKEIRKANPDTAFIFILQHTKAGDFRGGKDWEHMAEIAGEVYKGVVTITKNRYAPKGSLDFFRQIGIEWAELSPKEYTN